MNGKPFVKWAGGKGQLISQLETLLPADFAMRKNLVYVEPFVGGGAVLFHVLAKCPNIVRAVINDLNANLANCYRMVRDAPEDLVSRLRALQSEYAGRRNESERRNLFLEKRARYNSGDANVEEMTALFIFLNRTCFNGLYRVNSKGMFNVPFGRAVNPCICDEKTIWADSALLQKVEVTCGDFAHMSNGIDGDAFFYLDPPYRPLTRSAAFTAYSKDGFDDGEQKRLAEFCRNLDATGHRWLLSNSDPHNVNPHDTFFEELYAGFDIRRVRASRMINSRAAGRGPVSELAIRNYGGIT